MNWPPIFEGRPHRQRPSVSIEAEDGIPSRKKSSGEKEDHRGRGARRRIACCTVHGLRSQFFWRIDDNGYDQRFTDANTQNPNSHKSWQSASYTKPGGQCRKPNSSHCLQSGKWLWSSGSGAEYLRVLRTSAANALGTANTYTSASADRTDAYTCSNAAISDRGAASCDDIRRNKGFLQTGGHGRGIYSGCPYLL